MVFSSTGDTTRAPVDLRESATTLASSGWTGQGLVRKMARGLSKTAQGVFSAIFPSDCRLCSLPLTNISLLPVCPSCLNSIRPISCSTCDLCGEGLPQSSIGSSNQFCPACQEDAPSFDKAVAYGAYDGELRELIHLLKYEGVMPAADFLGQLLARAIQKLKIEGRYVVVPVPLHSSKRRQRGFNQADLIVRAALKVHSTYKARVVANALERVRPTVSQIGLTRPQRRENIRGAFRAAHLSEISGSNVLLVDDVLTTGTTASECARVLRRAGAEHVWVTTVARTLKNTQSFQYDSVGAEEEHVRA